MGNGVGLAGGFVAVGPGDAGLGEDIAIRVVGHGVHAPCRRIAVGGQAIEVVVGIGICFPGQVVSLGVEVADGSVEIVGDVHGSFDCLRGMPVGEYSQVWSIPPMAAEVVCPVAFASFRR
ncbi:hypothetical protein Barb6_03793 [Bacteroidales bacterium Barb6]|nr:hypothetical protein Barb6_03793 [Bacteroidales bacterium Barb6]